MYAALPFCRDCEDCAVRPHGNCRSRRSEEHTSELQSRQYLVCRLLLEKKKPTTSKASLRVICVGPAEHPDCRLYGLIRVSDDMVREDILQTARHATMSGVNM